MEKARTHAETGAQSAKVVVDGESFEWPLRERLLSSFLGLLANSLPSDEIKGMFWGDSGLRETISENLNDPLISQKKILASIPQQSKETVREFLEEFLTSGGNRPC